MDQLEHRLAHLIGVAICLIGSVLAIGNLLLFFALSGQIEPAPSPLVTGFAILMALVGGFIFAAGCLIVYADKSIQESSRTQIDSASTAISLQPAQTQPGQGPTVTLWEAPVKAARPPASRRRRWFFVSLTVIFLVLWLAPILMATLSGSSLDLVNLGLSASITTVSLILLDLFLFRLAYRSPSLAVTLGLTLLAILIGLVELGFDLFSIALMTSHP